jgi:hypothetical protein
LSSYLLVSVAVGLAQVADCALHVARKGRLGLTAMAFSVVEWTWGIASVVVIVRGPSGAPTRLAAVYIAYLLLWTAYGVAQIRAGRISHPFVLTPREALAGGAFGAAFALGAVILLSPGT